MNKDKKIPTLYKALTALILVLILAYFLLPASEKAEDLSQFEQDSHFIQSPLKAKISNINIKKGDTIEANTLLISLNHDKYLAEKTLAEANIELIKAGKEPKTAPLSLNIQNVITEKENILSQAKIKQESAVQEYTYWTNELAKARLQSRKNNLPEDERTKLSIAIDNAILMQKSADENIEHTRNEYKQAEKSLNEFKQTQKDLNRSYREVGIWQQKILEAEHFMAMSDLYSEAKIIILDVYVKLDDEIEKGQKLYKFALLP